MSDDVYEIRVDGAIPPEQFADFEGLESAAEPAVTVLHGPVQDQAALHGILARLRALGLEIVEVRRLPEQRGPADQPSAVAPRQRAPRSPRDDREA